jgi:hypothetical protein
MEKMTIKNLGSTLLRATIIGVCCVSILEIFPSSSTQAAPGGSCTSLYVEQSSDKNYYIFTVNGSGPDIKGYSVDFGDQQTYNFDFQKTPVSDRGTAQVKHTYQKDGNFTAAAKIVTSTISESSPACTVQITVGQAPVSQLPVTGPQDVTIFTTALFLGIVTYVVTFLLQRQFVVYTPKP